MKGKLQRLIQNESNFPKFDHDTNFSNLILLRNSLFDKYNESLNRLIQLNLFKEKESQNLKR